MKILFLDIDGVLNSWDFVIKRKYDLVLSFLSYPLSEFDPLAVERVNTILNETNAKLIISSDWRFTEGLDNILKKVGLRHPIHDITPYGMGKDRGYEIQEWLDEHDDVENYAIIDDINNMLDCQQSHFVQTSDIHGLTEDLMELTIKILNNNEK
ncbi:MAG: hypothetical protein K2H20_01565 [Bacilli bacterium]|nr:hypothetical protein [Bacilli bacterium]